MKTEQQIKDKIKEHENHITELIRDNETTWSDVVSDTIERLILGRKALIWVLSEKNLLPPDDFEKKANYEIMCYESGKIF